MGAERDQQPNASARVLRAPARERVESAGKARGRVQVKPAVTGGRDLDSSEHAGPTSNPRASQREHGRGRPGPAPAAGAHSSRSRRLVRSVAFSRGGSLKPGAARAARSET